MLNRRTLLQWIGALAATRPWTRVWASAQRPGAARASAFSVAQTAALAGIAEVVLPTALTPSDRDGVVRRFVAWHDHYTPGADMGHGYGNSTLRAPSGPAVVSRYAAQFTSLDDAAKAAGARVFALAPLAVRRTIVEHALNTPQPLSRLPPRPTGANLVADLTGFYFNSAAASDLAYHAKILRDQCRGLDGSDRAPAALGR